MMWKVLLGAAVLLGLGICAAFYFRDDAPVSEGFPPPEDVSGTDRPGPSGESEVATLGSGCFWCTEAVFQQLKGVQSVGSGYSGGSVKSPTYQQVCTGRTGHAEVVQVTFDPRVISYAEILEVFWRSHDPTTKNRQGNDYGPQYRSVIFTHSDRQRQLAERYRERIDAAHVYPAPLVTEIEPYTAFYPAEIDHQNYYAQHSRQSYCRVVIRPKLEKLHAVFQDKLKPAAE